jgi:NADH-quinone oxidoreductase subunit E
VARLNRQNTELAQEIIARYPRPRSALIPLLHLAQEQDGYVTEDAMAHLGELVGITPAEVLGTCSFYEMFKLHPVGKYVVNICTDISCMLLGGFELLEHAEEVLDVKAGNTTADGVFTLEDVECQAACTEAPCLQVNYRYFTNVEPAALDQLLDDLRAGRLDEDVPAHGTLHRIRQHIPGDRAAGVALPDAGREPVWLVANAAEGSD